MDRNELSELGFNENQIEYLLAFHDDMDIQFFRNSIRGVPNSPFFSQPKTPAEIIRRLRENDMNLSNEPSSDGPIIDSFNTTGEGHSVDSATDSIHDISVGSFASTASITDDDSFSGGRRRRKSKRCKRRRKSKRCRRRRSRRSRRSRRM